MPLNQQEHADLFNKLMDTLRSRRLGEESKMKELNKFIEAGGDVNAKMDDGFTPLFIAAQNGHTAIVAALIEARADVDIKELKGATPLHVAAYKGCTEALVTLIAARADVNAKKDDGTTPLHAAAYNGHAKALAALIAARTDVNAKMKDGVTPLHAAAHNGHAEALATLIAARADVKAKRTNGATPLHFAAQNGHTAIVDTLIEAGADFNAKMINGVTPLYAAVVNGHPKTAITLIFHGADPDEITKELVIDDVASALKERAQEKTITPQLATSECVFGKTGAGYPIAYIAAIYAATDALCSLIRNGANFEPLQTMGGTSVLSSYIMAPGDEVNKVLTTLLAYGATKPEIVKDTDIPEETDKEGLFLYLLGSAINRNYSASQKEEKARCLDFIFDEKNAELLAGLRERFSDSLTKEVVMSEIPQRELASASASSAAETSSTLLSDVFAGFSKSMEQASTAATQKSAVELGASSSSSSPDPSMAPIEKAAVGVAAQANWWRWSFGR